jgi:lactoylglutathione lyase
MTIRYLHTMVRVKDLDASKAFYEKLGLRETRRIDNEGGRFSSCSWRLRGRRTARWS